MKITINGDAYVLASEIKAEDIELLKKYDPDALKIKDKDGNDKFSVTYAEGKSGIQKFTDSACATFGGKTRDDAGNAALLVSDFKGRDTRIEVEVKGIPEHFSLRVLLLDNAHDLMETEAVCRDGKIILNKKEPGSAVFLLIFRIEN